MDLTLSRRGDYAVRAAVALAAAWERGGFSKTREVVEEMTIPASFAPEVLGVLVGAGLAEAKAGPTGGYRLTRPPPLISLLEVVEAAEGELVSVRCPMRGGPCRWDDVCVVHGAWAEVSETVRGAMGRTTLADLAVRDRELARSDRPRPEGARRGRPRRGSASGR